MTQDTSQSGPQTHDECPDWAQKIILLMREMEVRLGNIPDSDQWLTDDLDRLRSRAFSEDLEDSEVDSEKVEALFVRVASGLSREGFESSEIVAFVNSRIGYKGGPPYCNEREVEEAISAAR